MCCGSHCITSAKGETFRAAVSGRFGAGWSERQAETDNGKDNGKYGPMSAGGWYT
jgi:hypothetical protein